MAGPLAVALTADISSYQAAMARASDLAARHALDIAGSFTGAASKINLAFKGIEGLSKLPGQLNTAKTAAVGLAGTGAAIVAAYVAVSAAIGQANEQIERFIKLGDNAERAGVSVEFWQRFSEAAKAAKMEVAEIEAALKRAGNTVTPRFEQVDAVQKRLTELFESGFLGSFQSKGLTDYLGARDNETRIRAAVEAMSELRDLGEFTAMLDVGEKLFGADVADRIRSGRLDLEAIATSLDRQRDDLIKQEEVDRAAEFKERLAEAYQQIDDALHVSIALAGAGQGVLDVWLKIVEAVAKASVQAGTFLDRMIAAAKLPLQVPQGADVQSPLAPRQRGEGEGSLGADLGAAAGRGARGRTIYDAAIGPDQPAMTITDPPAPPRRPLSFYTDTREASPRGGSRSAPSSETLDQVETFINGLERSTEALKAEADAIGKTASERQSAINVARLEATARQQGITLTQEQINKVRELSASTVAYKEAIEEARDAQEALRSIGGDVLKGIASDARNGASAMDILSNAVGRLADRLSNKAMDGLADALFGSRNSTGGGLFGSLFGGGGGSGVGLGQIAGFLTGSVSPLPTFATGGMIHGPGTGTSDSILARVSNREFIVNAAATSRHRALLEQINAGAVRLPAFAEGGYVGGGAGSVTTAAGAPASVTIAPVINMHAQGGDPRQNADLAQQTAKAAESMIRSIVVSELMSQRRPGNILAG